MVLSAGHPLTRYSLLMEPTPADYLTRIRNRGRGGERNIPSHLHDKVRGEEFVRSLGIPTPERLRTFASPAKIKLDGLPDSFVLKPTFMSSSFGVMVLSRTYEGFRDHLRNRDLTIDEIREEQQKHADSVERATKEWIVEEKAVDAGGAEVPDDWKFFTFQGRIGLIHRTVRGPRNTHSFFDGDFLPIPLESGMLETNEKIIDRAVTSPPDSWQTMLNYARRISVAVPSPFVRIDMYNTVSGPLFGEFTLVPGTFFYEDREKMLPPLSSRMGRMWEEAELDLR